MTIKNVAIGQATTRADRHQLHRLELAFQIVAVLGPSVPALPTPVQVSGPGTVPLEMLVSEKLELLMINPTTTPSVTSTVA